MRTARARGRTPRAEQPTRLRLTARRFARNRLALLGLALLVLLFLAAYAGPLLTQIGRAHV